MASESTTPPPPSGGGGGAKYAIIGVALFAIAALVWCMTRPPDETPSGPVVEATIDAGVVERSTALVEDDFEIPELEPDAGPPPDAGVATATHRPRSTGGGGGSAWDQCSGDIPVAEVRRVFGEFNAQIRNCYERELKHNPLLQGNMTLALRVAPDGRVEGTQVSGSLHDREVFACVRTVSQRMRFPAPGGHDCAVIQAPFNFTPQQ